VNDARSTKHKDQSIKQSINQGKQEEWKNILEEKWMLHPFVYWSP
jgi:hypothetical protein